MLTEEQLTFLKVRKDFLTSKFLLRVSKLENGCWNFRGGRRGRYRKFAPKAGLHLMAHRFSAYLYKDFDLNSSKFVLHECDNPSCVNPDHLYIGNQFDNMQDRINSGNNPMLNKTHCPQDHEYNYVNTYNDANGHRHCVICMKIRDIARSN